MLFAQQAGGPPPWLAGLGVAILVGVCVVIIILLTVYVLFLLTLMRALDKCHPRNRTMEPGLVWLNLVPCLHLVWQFITVVRVAESLRNEFRSRGVRRDTDYGKALGLALLIVKLVGNIVDRATSVIGNAAGNQQLVLVAAGVSILFSVTTLVLFILYWVRIAGYSRELSEYVEDGYDDEDEPRRRRNADDGFDDLRDEDDLDDRGRR